MCVYNYMYIYKERERERDRERDLTHEITDAHVHVMHSTCSTHPPGADTRVSLRRSAQIHSTHSTHMRVHEHEHEHEHVHEHEHEHEHLHPRPCLRPRPSPAPAPARVHRAPPPQVGLAGSAKSVELAKNIINVGRPAAQSLDARG